MTRMKICYNLNLFVTSYQLFHDMIDIFSTIVSVNCAAVCVGNSLVSRYEICGYGIDKTRWRNIVKSDT